MLARFRLIPWLLSLVLALGTGTMAQARGQMAVQGFIEICAGQGTALVPLAPEDMTGAMHPCPDCLAAHGVALLPQAVQAARPLRAARLARPQARRPAAPAARPRPQARAPPAAA